MGSVPKVTPTLKDPLLSPCKNSCRQQSKSCITSSSNHSVKSKRASRTKTALRRRTQLSYNYYDEIQHAKFVYEDTSEKEALTSDEDYPGHQIKVSAERLTTRQISRLKRAHLRTQPQCKRLAQTSPYFATDSELSDDSSSFIFYSEHIDRNLHLSIPTRTRSQKSKKISKTNWLSHFSAKFATLGNGVFVSKSGLPHAGRGLFAGDFFREGQTVTFFQGIRRTREQALHLMNLQKATHLVSQKDGSWGVIDSRKLLPVNGVGGGSFANDPQNSKAINSQLVWKPFGLLEIPVLKAKRNIQPKEEIFVSYGRGSWHQGFYNAAIELEKAKKKGCFAWQDDIISDKFQHEKTDTPSNVSKLPLIKPELSKHLRSTHSPVLKCKKKFPCPSLNGSLKPETSFETKMCISASLSNHWKTHCRDSAISSKFSEIPLKTAIPEKPYSLLPQFTFRIQDANECMLLKQLNSPRTKGDNTTSTEISDERDTHLETSESDWENAESRQFPSAIDGNCDTPFVCPNHRTRVNTRHRMPTERILLAYQTGLL